MLIVFWQLPLERLLPHGFERHSIIPSRVWVMKVGSFHEMIMEIYRRVQPIQNLRALCAFQVPSINPGQGVECLSRVALRLNKGSRKELG